MVMAIFWPIYRERVEDAVINRRTELLRLCSMREVPLSGEYRRCRKRGGYGTVCMYIVACCRDKYSFHR